MNDYADSAERHYVGATALQTTCSASASHAYGISAECVLKALMSNLQPQLKRVSKNHIGSDLWREFENCQALSTHTNRVAVAKKFETHFSIWTLEQRYFNRNHTVFDAAILASQKVGADGLRSLLQQVQLGLI